MTGQHEDEKALFSEKLNLLWRTHKLEVAKKILLEETEKHPDEYYLWTSLSQTCSGLGDNVSALEYSKKAISLCDNDVLVLYNYSQALVNTGSYCEALSLCQKILSKTVEEISENGEGIRWAQSIRNDTMYLQGVCLDRLSNTKEALQVFKKLLTLRRRGLYSDYTKKQITDNIKNIEKLLLQNPNR